MNTENETVKNDLESSALCVLSRKAGRFIGKVIKYEERERAGEQDNVAVKTVGCLVKGIITFSDTAVKLVTAPFAKKEADTSQAPVEAEEQAEAEAAAAEAPAAEVAAEAAEQPAAEAEVVADEAPAAEVAVEAAEQAEEEVSAPASETPGKYSKAELEEKTKQQLMEIIDELGVTDTALWRPKDDLIARILAKQSDEE